MNFATAVVLLLLVLAGIAGYRKGMIRLVVSFVATILTLIIVTAITPYIADALKEHTGLYDYAKTKLEETLENNEISTTEISTEEIENSTEIPDVIKEVLLNASSEDVDNAVNSTIEDSGIYTSLAGAGANIIVRIVAFIISYAVIAFIFKVTIFSLGFVDKIPVVNKINRIAGAFLGVMKGVLALWIIGLFIFMMSGSNTGIKVVEVINESVLLKFLYDNNLLLELITAFIG